MNCQKYLKIGVITDGWVSVLMVVYRIWEGSQSSEYVYFERAALRILKREQENLDELMSTTFR